VLAWSRRADDGYHLALRDDAVVRDAPIEPFPQPVLSDVGPGRDGSAHVVYSRCLSPRRCDLFRMPVEGIGTFQPLSGLNLPGRAEYAPSIWGGRLVFGRAARVGPNGLLPYRGGGLFSGQSGRLSRALPVQTDLRRSVVAFAQSDFDSSRIAVKRFDSRGRGRVCRLATGFDGSAGGERRVSSVSLDGRFAYWLRDDVPPAFSGASPVTTLVRRRVPDRRCRPMGPPQAADGTPAAALEVAVTGGRVFYTDSTGVREAPGLATLFRR
jgi:hypothetical protein